MDSTPLADEPSLQRLRRAAGAALAGGAALLAVLMVLVGTLAAGLTALSAAPPVGSTAAGRTVDSLVERAAGSFGEHAGRLFGERAGFGEHAGGFADRIAAPSGGLGDLAIATTVAEGLYLLAALLVLHALPAHRGAGRVFTRFGPANQITLLRLVLVALMAALLTIPLDTPLRWIVVTIATVAAALDGLDGALARRTGLASAFGARFDMETDALLIMVLSLLVWHGGVAGPWVLLSGLLRYLFVAAGAAWPWLAQPLPASLRRKTVCVLQIVLLIGCLVPGPPAGLSATLAAVGLALLLHSFGTDVGWLYRHRPRAERRLPDPPR